MFDALGLQTLLNFLLQFTLFSLQVIVSTHSSFVHLLEGSQVLLALVNPSSFVVSAFVDIIYLIIKIIIFKMVIEIGSVLLFMDS